mmetsp:Transcript_1469/g.2960  ORF Transcript_1469/g.2960 Transcript_1469/m.2960 type:complete len:254 (+) Transcript_1469:845-1606(+)
MSFSTDGKATGAALNSHSVFPLVLTRRPNCSDMASWYLSHKSWYRKISLPDALSYIRIYPSWMSLKVWPRCLPLYMVTTNTISLILGPISDSHNSITSMSLDCLLPPIRLSFISLTVSCLLRRFPKYTKSLAEGNLPSFPRQKHRMSKSRSVVSLATVQPTPTCALYSPGYALLMLTMSPSFRLAQSCFTSQFPIVRSCMTVRNGWQTPSSVGKKIQAPSFKRCIRQNSTVVSLLRSDRTSWWHSSCSPSALF